MSIKSILFKSALLAGAAATLATGTITTAAAGATAAPVVPTLTQVSAAHHYGHDQLVFQFRGGVPAKYSARYVSRVIGDASGLPVNVVGSALLRVRFTPAAGHNEKGIVTYGATRRTYALPEIIQVANAGDFESVLSFGVGLAQKAPFHMYAQPRLGRVVLDVKAPFRTIPVRDYFLNSHRFAVGRAPYTEPVYRPVIPPATASGAMQRLFAGPTQAELARGLRFVSSGATGFRILSIRDGVARVQLTGKVSSGGSTFTIAGEIMPTLKQFRSVHWVKIYDQNGQTERPFGHSDSIPFSLEP
jgi:sporulation and spore germination protein